MGQEKKVYAFHGIIDSVIDESSFCHRNLVSKTDFIKFLNSIKENIKPTTQVLEDEGFAITIDDSTFASYDAAVTAISMGLHVTLFVNPQNIINQNEYWFNLISHALDKTNLLNIYYDNFFPLNSFQDKRIFREHVKQKFRRLNSENIIDIEVTKILELLKVENNISHKYLRVINLECIINLINIGVDIQSHLWNHLDATALTKDELIVSIKETNKWINSITKKDVNLIAPPFGEIIPDYGFPKELFNFCLLLDSRLHLGLIGKRYCNRISMNSKKIKTFLNI